MSFEHIQSEFLVPDELGEQRLDQVVAVLLPEHSRSRLQGWIKSGSITVNGQTKKPKDKVSVRDQIIVSVDIEAVADWSPEPVDFPVVFEDEDILVINKPAGLVVHPGAGNMNGTLVNGLLHRSPDIAKLPRAGVVHRLDKETTGVMVVAKSLVAHTSLVNQLQKRMMGREYEAVVYGVMTGGGSVDEPISRHGQNRKKMTVHPTGKPALTHYRIKERYDHFTHVMLKLETGRTHQIRVHMSHLHYPLVGDPVYGGRPRLPKGADDDLVDALRGFKRQALHAKKLTLNHPVTGEAMSWETELPDDIKALLRLLNRHDHTGDLVY